MLIVMGWADLGFQGKVDVYLQGQIEFTKGLREILGPLLAHKRRSLAATEHCIGQRHRAGGLSQVRRRHRASVSGFDRARFWRRRGAQPRLSYPLVKFAPPNDYPVSFSRFRLTLAGALATNSAVSWYNEPGGSTTDPPNNVVIFDEFVGGTLAKTGWLGAPRGETIHLAERGADAVNDRRQ